MTQISVFVASSSEGLELARQVRLFLQRELGDLGTVQLWPDAFEPGQTTIEDLERAIIDHDFAVVILTADDMSKVRTVEQPSPRDNLIFELGLFTAGLGRDRTSAWTARGIDIKLPSDIAGVARVTFDNTDGSRDCSLQRACIELAHRMRKKGPRSHWLAGLHATASRNQEFVRRIEGLWWDRVCERERNALGAFEISWDLTVAQVKLHGSAFDDKGNLQALWQSNMARLDPEHSKLAYLWTGRHPSANEANVHFHGFGYMEFLMPSEANARCDRASGVFWNVNESDPSKTVALSVDRWRMVDELEVRAMKSGSNAEKREVVRRVLSGV